MSQSDVTRRLEAQKLEVSPEVLEADVDYYRAIAA